MASFISLRASLRITSRVVVILKHSVICLKKKPLDKVAVYATCSSFFISNDWSLIAWMMLFEEGNALFSVFVWHHPTTI
jgi:hypothetical protein